MKSEPREVYKTVLIMKNRDTFVIGTYGDYYEAGEDGLRLHRFLFGYNNLKYNAPSKETDLIFDIYNRF